MIDVHAINGTNPLDYYDSVPWFLDLLSCHQCGCRDEAMRVVPGVGPLTARIMVVGQNPGAEEDERGAPFLGRGGEELDGWLRVLGLDRRKLLVTNVVKCHTTGNRKPRSREIAACEPWLRRELQAFPHVEVVIPLGRPALDALVGKMDGIPDVMQPWWVSVSAGDDRNLLLLPLAHPAYLLRVPAQRPVMLERVLPWVRDYLKTEKPDVYAASRL